MDIKQSQYIIKRVSERPEFIREMEAKDFDYPEELNFLHEVIERNLSKYPLLPKEVNLSLMLDIASTMGGYQFYLPKGETILIALRDVLIKHDFDGQNTEELASRHSMSTQGISRSLRRTPKLKRPNLRLGSNTLVSVGKIKWPNRVNELCRIIEEALTPLGINDAISIQNVALHVMQAYGGGNRYFPRGEIIKKHFLNCEMYALRCQGVPVKQIARKYGTSAKNVYDICAQLKKEAEQQGNGNE